MTKTTKEMIIKEIKEIQEDTGISPKAVAKKAGIVLTSKTVKADLEIVLARMTQYHDSRVKLANAIKQMGGEASIKTSTKELKAAYDQMVLNRNNKQQNKEETTMTNPNDQLLKMMQAQQEILIQMQAKLDMTTELAALTSDRLDVMEANNIIKEKAPVIIDQEPEQLPEPKKELTQEQKIAKTVAFINHQFGAPVAKEDMDLEAMKVLYKQAKSMKEEKQNAEQAEYVSEPVLPEGTPVTVDPDEIVFTDAQLTVLEKAKEAGDYEQIKTMYERTNRALNRTVGGVLSGTARFVDEGGRKAVDGVHGFIGQAIDSVRGITLQIVDLGATTLHTANNLGQSAGHIVIDGIVYTLDSAGNLTKRN